MSKLTPMMAQYRQVKEKYHDCILMFRLGDFYEMFFEDALEAAKILQITLTSRNKGSEEKTPMCGIPYHAVDQYLYKLTRAGKKVAVCDQMTEPDGRGIVEREVIRVVTPGTTFDQNIIEQKTNNYVGCIIEGFGLAYADVTTGEFKVCELDTLKALESELARLRPAECIVPNDLQQKGQSFLSGLKQSGMAVFPFDFFDEAEEYLKKHFQVHSLQIFNLENKNRAVRAAAMLMAYLKETQKTNLQHIQKISFYTLSDFMPLDEACIRNLELFFNNRDGKKEGSLINVMDHTVTAMGGRMLRKWLLHPLLNEAEIDGRLDKVGSFAGDSSLLRNVRDCLCKIQDIERLLSKLSLGTGNARDLVAMKHSLMAVPQLKSLVTDDSLHDLKEIYELIERAIKEDAPAIVREGGMIKSGFNKELDELLSISAEGKTFIKNLQEREIKRTGISSLKVKFNKIFGYYIEISNANLGLVPADYMRKQTLVNAERFITPELKEYEEKVLHAEEKIRELEYELFYQVRMEIIKELKRIQELAVAIAELDCFSALAFLAVKNNYSRPQIVQDGVMEIKNGRHPVVEQVVEDFVPNDCRFDSEGKFLLITGPNMGGKSTYLRQIALISLMAQIGSFVPAESAKLALVDRIFTRVGASDNLVRGESTFMVEMNEAAYILNNATERSLIVLDEIGRGTSTYDGVSIAWAISEYIHDKIGAKTLFATHYHELIELADRLPKAKNLSVVVRENEEEGVVFLYKIVEGGVDKSYGIEVAKLAGLPVDVVSRARGVLAELETKHIKKERIDPGQMGLFLEEKERRHVRLVNELKAMDIQNMTPLEAMYKLDEIKKKFP